MSTTFSPEQYEQIRKLAYERLVARGYEDGLDVEDWLAAEQELVSGNTDIADELEAIEIFEDEGNRAIEAAGQFTSTHRIG